MSPDPAFLKFFATEFQTRLSDTEIPGMSGASWDRRAAYLLWVAEGRALPAMPSEKPTDTSDSGSIFD